MTSPKVYRVFFAIDLPDLAKEQIGHFIGQLKKNSKNQAIRWSRPENLHITLHLLPEVKIEDLKSLLENVRLKLEGMMKNLSFQLGEILIFPNPFRPRVIVIDILPQEKLNELAILVGKGIEASAYEIEARTFKAHLTLGRIKQMQNVNLSFLTEAKVPVLAPIEVGEIVLFRSQPDEHGSTYTRLDSISLSQLDILREAH